MSVAKQFVLKKTIAKNETESGGGNLKRCLTTFDLVALGVGSTLGAGVYVLTGSVSRDKAGPSIVLSFLFAAIASVMAGLSYAEFGARVPKAGSAYVYSYVTVGELWAFVIGWNLILEYVIGTSSVARAWSENIDALIGGKYSEFCMTHLKMNVPGFAKYPDFFAFAVILILTAVLCFGVKESALISKIFTGVNIIVILFVIIAGSITANVGNWAITPKQINEYIMDECSANDSNRMQSGLMEETPNKLGLNCTAAAEGLSDRFGHGGFLPYSFSGMMSGAATCFFGFVGFDIIATTGEEVKNPQKSIPLSIVISLAIVFFAYVGISTVLTLMVPYFMMDVGAPLPRAFEAIGWNWALYPLAIGAVCALSSSLMGGLFPMPRVVYAMAQDGLIFKSLARVHKRFQTPVLATMVSGLLAAIMVLLFDLEDLVDMMSIGTLLAYTLVAICVLILRYQPDVTDELLATQSELGQNLDCLESNKSLINRALHPTKSYPSNSSGQLVYGCVMVAGALTVLLCALLVNYSKLNPTFAVVAYVVLLLLITAVGTVIWRQPQSKKKLSFTVPLVPFLPIASMICNIYLMCELSMGTWIRFAVWMAIGFAIYGFYGYKNSVERMKQRNRRLTISDEQKHMLREA